MFMNTFTMNKPEVFIGNSANEFNAQGELTDETTSKFISELLASLESLAQRVAFRDLGTTHGQLRTESPRP